ncbi:MAG: hypothetical protein R2824_04805 [Saprospiraceae bacterium]|nr:hypothetical protein [Lewinella sp.]
MPFKINLSVLLVLLATSLWAQPTNIQKAVLSVEQIWDRAAHNAFTDLVFFRDSWYCTFREGTGHIPGVNGSIRVIASNDGQNWYSVALISELDVDLRDPKLSITPDKRLMLNMEAAFYEGTVVKKRESWVSFSDKKGKQFGPNQKITFPADIATTNDWLWRVEWHTGTGYGVIYQPGESTWNIRLLKTTDGLSYQLVTTFDIEGKPNETTLRFTPDGHMIALVRREGDDQMGMIGRSAPPYHNWDWKRLSARLGGPNFVQLPDGRLICATRDYTGSDHTTVLAFIDTDGEFTPILTLPSRGDTSYPGMVLHDDVLHISYYSGHEGKTSIYRARLSVKGLEGL